MPSCNFFSCLLGLMDDRKLDCYPRSGTCSSRGSICYVLLTFSPFKCPLQIPKARPKFEVLLSLYRGVSYHYSARKGAEFRIRDGFFFSFFSCRDLVIIDFFCNLRRAIKLILTNIVSFNSIKMPKSASAN